MSEELKIFVIFHKPFEKIKSSTITPYQVGTFFKKPDEIFEKDNDTQGENIGHYHARICEYSAYFQICKNYKLPDFVGFMQYRRYFLLSPEREGFPPMLLEPSEIELQTLAHWLDVDNVKSILSRHDVIVPTRYHCGNQTIAEHFIDVHGQDLYKIFSVALKDLDEDAALDWMENEHRFHLYNMFIARRDVFLSYMKDAMPLLDLLLKKLPEIADPYQKRRIAFCMERYLPYWMCRHKLGLYESQICLLEKNAL